MVVVADAPAEKAYWGMTLAGASTILGPVVRTLRCGVGLLNVLSDHAEPWAYPQPV